MEKSNWSFITVAEWTVKSYLMIDNALL